MSAAAQEAPSSAAVAQSNVATRLFVGLCIPSMGNREKLSVLATQYNLRDVDPSFSEKVLGGKTGKVWSAPSPLGKFIVIWQSDNSCSVWARRADAATSIQHFKRILTGTQRPGLQLRVIADRDVEGQGGTYHYLSYFLSRDGQEIGAFASIGATSSDAAEVQVRLRLERAKSNGVPDSGTP
ncbi:NMCC_0638 family (lipo)protein [Paraburkholderia phenoliruptrix]|uniref:NMCC_0638 family (lipo)protein n=1 Tax=Paraburkholderia phenoliruptrix TaxID=252970 RepID=UPI003F5CB09D